MVIKLRHLRDLWGDPNGIDQSGLNFNDPVGPICTDSRKLSKGCLFIALQGELYDGHDFLDQVVKSKPQAVVIKRKFINKIPHGIPCWAVDGTLTAYQQIGLLHRSHLNIPVVAVTGSTGKTTTRQLIKASLKSLGNVVSSVNNNNNDVGVPLTLLSANSSHSALVVEMGMRGLGEIERLSKFSNPDVAVITNIGSAHIGLLGSYENIAKAKCEITSFLRPTGLVVIPAYDPLLERQLFSQWHGRVIRVSIEDQLPLHTTNIALLNNQQLPDADLVGKVLLDDGLLILEGETYQLPLEGRHNAMNFLLAIAVARELGVDLSNLKQLTVDLPKGRHNYIKIGDITYIDETYNASPEAVHASLDLLARIKGRHFAVLGKMFELGEESLNLHIDVAKHVVNLGLDGLVIVADGKEALEMAKVAHSIKNLAVVSKAEEAYIPLNKWLLPGDFVLLKGSRAVELDRLLHYLKIKDS